MKMFQKMLLTAVTGLTMLTNAYADPTNFSYTTISAGLGKTSYKTPVCVAGECYTELGGVGFSGAYQFADDWLVISLGGEAASNTGPTTKLTSSVGYIELDVVKAIGSQIDIGAGVASLSGKAEACLGSTCVTNDDTGTLYGAGINAWFDASKKIAGHLKVSSSKYSKSTQSTTTTSLGLSYYFTKNHELLFNYSTNDSATGTSLNYAYHF